MPTMDIRKEQFKIFFKVTLKAKRKYQMIQCKISFGKIGYLGWIIDQLYIENFQQGFVGFMKQSRSEKRWFSKEKILSY